MTQMFSHLRVPDSKLGALALAGCCIGLAVSASATFAQSPPLRSNSPAGTTPPGEEIIQLNPFTIQADEVRGYQATSTLAGTRIKSDLRDIASTISVFTDQFIEDVGAANATDLLVYAAGTEVAGAGGTLTNAGRTNFGFDLAPERFVPNATTRVRGLAGADTTRGSYRTLIPFDSYNTDRVTINRGANSILYGLGSPAGIIDTTLVGPLPRNATEVTARFDRYGSFRTSLDVNRVLIKDRLSARLIGLHDWQEFEQEPSFDKNRRLFAAVEARPFGATRIRASVEFGDRDGSPETLEPPRDRLVNWWTYGNPVVPFGVNGTTATIGTHPIDLLSAAPARAAVLFFDAGPLNAPTWGQLALPTGVGMVTPVFQPGDPLFDRLPPAVRNNYAPFYSTIDDPARSQMWALNGNPRNPASALGRSTQILDRSIFDYVKKNMAGRNDRRTNRFSAVNVAIDRTFLNREFGAEIAWDHQAFRHSGIDFLGVNFRARNIGIDINEARYDGSPNPNLGRPFMISSPLWFENRDENDTFRLTTFASFDAGRKIGRRWAWLGKHVLTGMFERNETESRGISGQLFAYQKAFGDAIGYQATSNRVNAELRGQMLFYVGPSLLHAASPAGANLDRLPDHITLPTSATITYTDRATRRITTSTFGTYTYPQDKAVLTNDAFLRSSETDSVAFALQSKWWNDTIVATFGWRRDNFEQFDAGAAPLDSLGSRQVDPGQYFLPSTPALTLEEESHSLGVVVHAPAFVKRALPWGMSASLHYSTSENFSPSVTTRNPFGGFFPSPSGKTKDYGASLSFFDNRISVRYTRYTTNQDNLADERVDPVYAWFFNQVPADVYNNNPIAQINAAGFELPDERIREALGWTFTTAPDGSVRLETSYRASDVVQAVSKGHEIELVGNVTSNWRVMMNAAQQEAVRTGTAQTAGAEVMRLADAWLNNPAVAEGFVGPGGLAAHVRNQGLQRMQTFRSVLAGEGKKADELREWRFNAVTSYTFGGDSRFRGLGLGAGLRWQDKVVIGYQAKNDLEAGGWISDLSRPVYGPTESITDVWISYKFPRKLWRGVGWSMQLNVRNVFDHDDLVPIWFNAPETNLHPHVYRLQRGRDWFVTTRFTF